MTGTCDKAEISHWSLSDLRSCEDGPDTSSLCWADLLPRCISAQSPAEGRRFEEKVQSKLRTIAWEYFLYWSQTWDILTSSLALVGDRNLLTLHYYRLNAEANLHYHGGPGRWRRPQEGGFLRAGPGILLNFQGRLSEYNLVIQLGILSNPGTWKANIETVNTHRMIPICED